MVATVAAGILYREYVQKAGFTSDFGIVWFAARAMLEGRNPYLLVGPGLEFELGTPLLYPATAFIPAMPFAFFSEQAASMTFVWLSTFLLAFGITRTSWHLMPIFVTEAFASSARLAQWSLVLTAALFIPWLALFVAAKPHSGLPVLSSATSWRPWVYSMLAGAVFLALSLLLLPGWPEQWLELTATAAHMKPPIMRLGGALVLLVLLRWRRPEAWLILAIALVPQTWGSYSILMLFTVPSTWREAAMLAIVSSLGSAIGPFLIRPGVPLETFVGNLLIFTAYLPAVLIVLRRPNSGRLPVWLSVLPVSRKYLDPHAKGAAPTSRDG